VTRSSDEIEGSVPSHEPGITPESDAPPLLSVRDLSVGFQTPNGLVRAVDGVTFSLAAGRTLGIVGESGSGKTILARAIMGLTPSVGLVRSGQVTFDHQDLEDLPVRQLRRLWGVEMSMVFQDPMTSLNPVMTVGRQITEPLRHHLNRKRRQAKSDAIALLRSVGIAEPARRFREYPHELSGGMRQRALIAIALACQPKLLFADEPTTALDVTVQAQILDLLATIQSERGMAMVLITHDLAVVAGRTDEIAVMYAGRIVEQAPTEVLFTQMKMPYTQALIRSIPRLSDRPHTRSVVIPGRPPDPLSATDGCAFAPRCPYAKQRCRVEAPPLVPADNPRHRYACWYPVEEAST
jgi:oligopeptide/dipeptide ABC transporter ATP-binding protein